MAAYLAEHIPHLQSLHLLLGLPSTALTSDQTQIETAIRNAVTSLIRNREQEVDEWRDRIDDAKRDLMGVARALGEKGRGVMATARRESEGSEPLPKQYSKLVEQKEELEKEYSERLTRIQTVRGQLDALATLLGPPFEPPKPLESVAGPSRLQPVNIPNGAKRRSSTLHLHPRMSRERSGSGSKAVDGTTSGGEAWMDVGETVLEALEADLQKAIEERELRLQQLSDHFRDLLFLHAELLLPPIPLSHPHHFPIHLLPPRTLEETPGAHATYEKTLSRYINVNQKSLEMEDDKDGEGEVVLAGLEGVEPEVGLLSWAGELSGLWFEERTAREGRIQALYDQLEPLWMRLEVEQDVIDLFMEMNRGCGDPTIKAYQVELERCLELRRSSLSSFVLAARKEIELLWSELMLSDDEKGEFGEFIDDDYTEDLLHKHEEYAEQLRAEIEGKAALLARVREWYALKADEEELERSAMDPNRFSKRGGAMLREEKLRKRVGVLMPKVEAELESTLPAWEDANGRPFMVGGERVVDKILDAREAKEMAKEAKKRAKQGLAPTKMVASVRSAKATPAPSTLRAQPGSTISRKREAPTPTPMGAYHSTLKRPRTGMAGVGSQSINTKTRIPSSTATLIRARETGNISPTPISGLPRPISTSYGSASTRTFSGQSTASSSSIFTASSGTTKVGSIIYGSTIREHAALGKDAMRRPERVGVGERRKSFKPRMSVVGGLLAAAVARRDSFGGLEEEEEGDEVY